MQLDTKMNTEVLKNKIQELKSHAVLYEHGITSDIIERCNLIVEIGALTVGTDDTGKVITHNTNTPTQFSQEAVDEIMTICFKNGSGEKIFPKVYGRNEWYRSRLDMVNETLELLEKMPS
ncbi:MAG: hypothetical protein KKA10_04110 [Euryarchaeota archaeon]|nr:hypothetical protein [Euryarchaeota archaeon]MCG2738482.1 hypothetical protein [Candidatus Methanoperedenaceae archaeon]